MWRSLLDEAVWIRAGYALLLALPLGCLSFAVEPALFLAALVVLVVLQEAARAQSRPKAAKVTAGVAFVSLPAVMTLAALLRRFLFGPDWPDSVFADLPFRLLALSAFAFLVAWLQERPERAARGETLRSFGCLVQFLYIFLSLILFHWATEISCRPLSPPSRALAPALSVARPAAEAPSASGADLRPAAPPSLPPHTGLDEAALEEACRAEILRFDAAHDRYLQSELRAPAGTPLVDLLVREGFLARPPHCPGGGQYRLELVPNPGTGVRLTLKCSRHDSL